MVKVNYAHKARLDTFIYKFFNTKEVAFHPNAAKIALRPAGHPVEKSILEGLMDAIHEYRIQEPDSIFLGERVDECILWLDRADGYKVIMDGPLKQLEAKTKRIDELEKQLSETRKLYDVQVDANDDLRDQVMEWQNRHKECDDKYNKLINAFSGRGSIQP